MNTNQYPFDDIHSQVLDEMPNPKIPEHIRPGHHGLLIEWLDGVTQIPFSDISLMWATLMQQQYSKSEVVVYAKVIRTSVDGHPTETSYPVEHIQAATVRATPFQFELFGRKELTTTEGLKHIADDAGQTI